MLSQLSKSSATTVIKEEPTSDEDELNSGPLKVEVEVKLEVAEKENEEEEENEEDIFSNSEEIKPEELELKYEVKEEENWMVEIEQDPNVTNPLELTSDSEFNFLHDHKEENLGGQEFNSSILPHPSSSPSVDRKEEEEESITAKNGKNRRTANPEKWTRNVNKTKRSHGQAYERRRTIYTGQGVILQPVIVPARQMGPRCNSKRCTKLKKCSQFTEEQRKNIFDSFWKMSWEEKESFVCFFVEAQEPKSRAKVRSFNKEATMIYFLNNHNVKTKVCRQMFLSTLGITRSQVYGWLKRKNNNNININNSNDNNNNYNYWTGEIEQEEEEEEEGNLTTTIINPLESNSNSDFPLLLKYEVDLSDEDQDFNVHSSSTLQQYNFETSNTNINMNSFPSSSSSLSFVSREIKEEEEEEDFIVGRDGRRRKRANPEEWTRNVNKRKRTHGQEYERRIPINTDQGVILQPVIVPARQMGPRCNSKRCTKLKKCSQFTEEQRKSIFDSFWKMSWEEKESFVCFFVEAQEPKSRAKIRSFDKEATMTYFLNNSNNNVRTKVCRQMFLSTLGITRSQVYGWLKRKNNNNNNSNDNNNSSRDSSMPKPLHRPPPSDNSQIVKRRNFLNNFFHRYSISPSPSSSSTIDSSTTTYLQPHIKSNSQLMRIYKEECKQNKLKPFARHKFENTFHQLNLCLYKRRQD